MKIFLHDDIASPRKVGIIVTNEYRVDRCLTCGIFRSVDEADEIPGFELPDSVHFVGWGSGLTNARHDLRR